MGVISKVISLQHYVFDICVMMSEVHYCYTNLEMIKVKKNTWK